MHIDGLVSSFKPDIAFRFSLGLSAASPRISAFINQSAAALLVGRPAVAAAASCTSEASDLFDEFLDFTQTPQGMLVVAGAASLLTQYRTRIVSYGAVLFFALCVFCSKMPLSLPSRIDQSALRYVYERASYTKSAKIHRFKNQLIEHTKGNLDQLVPHTAYVHFVAHASKVAGTHSTVTQILCLGRSWEATVRTNGTNACCRATDGRESGKRDRRL